MAKRFRCYRCNNPKGLEFESDGPKCPSCGQENCTPLVNVHWLMPQEGGPIPEFNLHGLTGNQRAVACKPQLATLEKRHATGDVLCVTCPACMATDEFKATLEVIKDLNED